MAFCSGQSSLEAWPLEEPRDVAQHVERQRQHTEGERRQADLQRAQESFAPQRHEQEPRKGRGEQARPAGREGEPQREAGERHAKQGEPLAQRGAQNEQDRCHLKQHGEDVGHRDAALHQVDAVEQEQDRREQRRTLGSKRGACQQEEDGRQERSREGRGEPPCPGNEPKGPHADGDEQLGRRRVYPLRRRLTLEILERRLRVVHLVEVLDGRRSEARESAYRRHRDECETDVEVAAGKGGGFQGAHRLAWATGPSSPWLKPFRGGDGGRRS